MTEARERVDLAADGVRELILEAEHRLQRDAPRRIVDVLGFVDDAHAAAPEDAPDPIAPDDVGSARAEAHAATLQRRPTARHARQNCAFSVEPSSASVDALPPERYAS